MYSNKRENAKGPLHIQQKRQVTSVQSVCTGELDFLQLLVQDELSYKMASHGISLAARSTFLHQEKTWDCTQPSTLPSIQVLSEPHLKLHEEL